MVCVSHKKHWKKPNIQIYMIIKLYFHITLTVANNTTKQLFCYIFLYSTIIVFKYITNINVKTCSRTKKNQQERNT